MHSFTHKFNYLKSLLTIFLIGGMVSGSLGQSDNYSGLKDKYFSLEQSLGSLSSQMFPEVLGQITRLKVRSDKPTELKLVLHFTGFEEAYLRAEILDENKKPVREIKAVTGHLKGLSSPLELTFQLKPNVESNTNLRTGYVMFTLSSMPGRRGPDTPFFIFDMYKAWSNSKEAMSYTDNQNQAVVTNSKLVNVVLNPIGSAAQLREGNLPRPSKTIFANQTPSHLNQSSLDSTLQIDRSPHGPATQRISLWEGIQSDIEFDFDDISQISLDVYRDQNPASNQFYFLPSSYNLAWSPKNGYKLSQLYGTAQDPNSDGEVRIHATLSSGINSRELNMVQKLLDGYATRNLGIHNARIQAIPMDGAPSVTFSDELSSLYNISADRVSVTATSKITDPIKVSFATDSRTKEEIVVALKENVGLNGSMSIRPAGDSLPTQNIPVNININDEETFGRFDIISQDWRKDHWMNETPYPVSLNYMHIMVMSEDHSPFIYSWDLGNTGVNSGAKVFFDAQQVPHWLDNYEGKVRMWIEYSVLPCMGCDNQVIADALGGTTGELVKEITFEPLFVLEKTGAAVMRIQVRSVQADPRGQVMKVLPTLDLRSDITTQTGPLYVEPGHAPAFEYNLALIMEDGTMYQSSKWIPSNQLTVYLGTKNIQEAIPQFPWENR
ncbi:MAG: hypothetical protein R3B93_17775 [Bacteroidia bacterium]